MVRANNPNLLREHGGDLVLTDKWARGVLEKLTWSKRKVTTGKVDPSPQFLAEEKFTFQRNISVLVSEHDIPPSLIINIDQTLLSYVNTGKYTFSFKGAKNIPIKGVDDKRQISYFCGQLHWRVFTNPANLCRENRTKSDQVFSTFFFCNVHRKSLVKRREIC